MYQVCDVCGAPLSIGMGDAETEIDALKEKNERLRGELDRAQRAARALRVHTHKGLEVSADGGMCHSPEYLWPWLEEEG